MAFDFPSSPTTGQQFTPPGGPTYTYNGYAWSWSGGASGGGGGGATVTISDTPPASPTAGSLWWESDTGIFWIYYNDGNSLQWVALSAIGGGSTTGVLNVQVFTASGTYTPTAGMQTAQIECVGGGAGGNGFTGASSTSVYGLGGGGAGGYSRKLVFANQVGASQTVTIGAGGAGGAATFGLAGSATSVGALCLANGAPAPTGAASITIPGGAGASVTGAIGDIKSGGAPGGPGSSNSTASGISPSGVGGSSIFGGGGASVPYQASAGLYPGNPATSYGSGGGGGFAQGAAGNVNGGNGSSGIVIITEYAAVAASTTAAAAPVPASLSGLTLTWNSTTSLAIAAGGACSDDNSTQITTQGIASKLIKTAWSAGSGGGSLDTGAIATGTWYHVFLIMNVSSGAVDVLTSLSATAPTLPSGYTKQRRIGSIKTDGSSNMLSFSQLGDSFLWTVGITEYSNSAVGNTSPALWAFFGVPLGVKTEAFFSVYMATPVTAAVYIKSPDGSTGNTSNIFYTAGSAAATTLDIRVRTNIAAQINLWASVTFASGLYIYTMGWTDNRGK